MNYYQIIKSSKHNFKDFARHIALFLGQEFSEDFYQRTYQIISPDGSTTPTEREIQAYDWWVETLRDPFQKSSIAFKVKDLPEALIDIEKKIQSPYNHKHTLVNKLRSIRSSIS